MQAQENIEAPDIIWRVQNEDKCNYIAGTGTETIRWQGSGYSEGGANILGGFMFTQ